MIDIELAQRIWRMIEATSFADLKENLIESAIQYARCRVDWLLADPEKRQLLEADRTVAHNALISWCDILARNMSKRDEDPAWRQLLGHDRKTIGDFACWLHCLLGISAR